jgi:hypothetical protein
MAFNPFKRNVEAPVEQQNVPNQIAEKNEYSDYDDLGQYDTSKNTAKSEEPSIQSIREIKENLQYEGNNIADLESSGLQTVNLLKVASPEALERPKFNVPLLDATPVNFVLQSIGATQVKENLYEVYGQQIATQENKWYNKTQKKGKHNAINLLKHLIAISENINEEENQKSLFLAACQKLNALQEKAQDLIVEQKEEVKEDKKPSETTAKESTKEFKYEVSDAVKQAQAQSEKIDWKLVREQLNNIPLDVIMDYLKADPNEDGHRGKWKVPLTGHNVAVTGIKWFDYNTQKGDKGAISLMAYHLAIKNGMPYVSDEDKWEAKKLATKEMLNLFGSQYNIHSASNAANSIDYKEPFNPPYVIDFKINSVRQYLNEKRGLPMWVINKQIKAGFLFAGYPSDWKENKNLKNPDLLSNKDVWATFLAVNGNAAEMRAIERTDNLAKILAKGSDKALGGFTIKAEKDCTEHTIVACEAAIDTMSYHSIYPGRNVFSCMGVNFNLAVKAAIDALDRGYKFQLAFDNDLAGNEAAVRFREQLINEIGEEEYAEYYNDGQIGYFDLGIKCLLNTIKRGGVYYFDVKENDTGKEAATMFQKELFKVMPRDTVKDLIKKGKIKYANVAPAYGLMLDPEKEAEKVVAQLLSPSPFYIVLKQGDDDEKDDVRIKREAFEAAFVKACGDNLEQFEKDGKIIYQKQAFAKDWNEFFVIMKKSPKAQERLTEFEEKYSSVYNQDDAPKSTKKKKP